MERVSGRGRDERGVAARERIRLELWPAMRPSEGVIVTDSFYSNDAVWLDQRSDPAAEGDASRWGGVSNDLPHWRNDEVDDPPK